jgi:hypothetical protein
VRKLKNLGDFKSNFDERITEQSIESGMHTRYKQNNTIYNAHEMYQAIPIK